VVRKRAGKRLRRLTTLGEEYCVVQCDRRQAVNRTRSNDETGGTKKIRLREGVKKRRALEGGVIQRGNRCVLQKRPKTKRGKKKKRDHRGNAGGLYREGAS